jgi:signal peptidase II
MSFLVGGILGNVTDRIIWGYVVDFIVLGPPTLTSPAFNIADALQWVGYGLIVIALVKDGELLWPDNDSRKKFWVNRKFQLKYCFVLVGVGLSLSTLGLVFSYTYLRVTIMELVGNYSYLLDKFLLPYVVSFLLMCGIFCAALFVVGKIISHRIAGPMYAFERYLNDILQGKDIQLKLRTGDDFKHLELLANKVHEELKKIRQHNSSAVTEQKKDGP